MNRVLKAYLSYTSSDMSPYKDKVKRTIEGLNIFAKETIAGPAQDDSTLDVCLHDIESCDIFICLVGHKLGWTPKHVKNPDHLSIIELEYIHAGKIGIPRIVFLGDEKSVKKVDSDYNNPQPIEEFRNRLLSGNDCYPKEFPYDDVSELTTYVLASIINFIGLPNNTTVKLWPKDTSPYPGLTSFSYEDSLVYFGRSRQVADSINLLSKPDCNFLLVSGASGTGKSSLVMAGIIPKLLPERTKRELDDELIFIRPGHHINPFQPIAIAIRSKDNTNLSWRSLVDRWNTNSTYLYEDFVSANLKTRYLVIDQMEELFTIGDPTESAHFISSIFHFLKQSNKAEFGVLATIRSDFRDQCQDFSPLRDVLEKGHYLDLFSLSSDSIHEMIAGPAKVAGLDVSEILGELHTETEETPRNLPLLAAALKKLWELRCGSKLTKSSLASIGGIDGVIASNAENAYGLFVNMVGETIAEESFNKLFRLLVRIKASGEISRSPFDRSILDDAESQRLVEIFAGEGVRLLSLDRGAAGNQIVDVSHEALFHAWPKLLEWITNRLSSERELAQIVNRSKDWEERGYPISHLHIVHIHDGIAAYKKLGLQQDSNHRSQRYDRLLHQYLFPIDRLNSMIIEPLAKTGHQERARIGDILQTLYQPWDCGDEREGASVNTSGLPNCDKNFWCLLETTASATEKYRSSQFAAHKKYSIGRWPVTQRQYRAFIDAEDGYHKSSWWHPNYIPRSPPQLVRERDNHPMTECSWAEAVAYARWLNKKMREIAPIDEDLMIRLPTEEEWLFAARDICEAYYRSQTHFWQASPANTADANLKRTVAVGMYPQSRTAEGVEDLIGNIWEWTLTKFEKPDVIDFDLSDDKRVMCGGSWFESYGSFRGGLNNRDGTNRRSTSIGFRLCLSSILSSYC